MSSEDVMPMYEEFPVWIREFELEEDEGTREKCWAGVDAFVEGAESDEIENLVRLAFNTRQKASASFLQTFRATFHDANPEFEILDNDREVEVLAGCCLTVLLDNNDAELSALVALAITAVSAGSNRKHNLPMDIAGLAENALRKISESNSKRPDLNECRIELPELSLDEADVPTAFTEITSALQSISKSHNLVIDATNTVINQQDEELQMLWWLTGGRSIDEDCEFTKIDKKFQPLLFAKELADQTEVLPGPGSIKGLLSRAGLKATGSLTVKDVISNAKAEWLSELVEDIEPSPVTQPIHYAIKRQLETGPGDAWLAGWAAATELDAGLSFSPLIFGSLFYRECLLELFLGE